MLSVLSPIQTHPVKPRSQLFMTHQWLPISSPGAPAFATISAVSQPAAEALVHEAIRPVGVIIQVGVAILLAVDEVQLPQAHSVDNKTVCTATWSIGMVG